MQIVCGKPRWQWHPLPHKGKDRTYSGYRRKEMPSVLFLDFTHFGGYKQDNNRDGQKDDHEGILGKQFGLFG